MIRELIVAVAVLCVIGTAAAAELSPETEPAPHVVNWSGFYVGAHLGWAATKSTVTESPWWTGIDEVKGMSGGGQVGFNWQFPRKVVIGIESQIAVAAEKDWLASLTGKVGYAFSSLLLYAKAGGVWGDPKLELFNRRTRSGWTVGAGAEWMFAPNWSAMVEYQYYDFGEQKYADRTGGWARMETARNNIRVGLSYHF